MEQQLGAAAFGQAPRAADISCSLERYGCRLLLQGFVVRLLRPSPLSLVPVSALSVPPFVAAGAMARAKRGSASAAAAAVAGELAPVGAAAQPGGIFPLPSVSAPAKAAPRRAARRGRAPAAAPAVVAPPSAEVAQVEALLMADVKAEPEPAAAAGVPVAPAPAPAKRRRTAKAIKAEAVAAVEAELEAQVEAPADAAPAARPKKPRAKPLHRDKAVSAAYEATMAAVATGEVAFEVPATPPPAKRRRGKAAAAAAVAGVCLSLELPVVVSQPDVSCMPICRSVADPVVG